MNAALIAETSPSTTPTLMPPSTSPALSPVSTSMMSPASTQAFAPVLSVPVIPENAPFTSDQRAWLNGFFAGLLSTSASAGPAMVNRPAPVEEEQFPWHDSAITLDERMNLAKDKPLSRRMMAAMAQLDCGSCGYVCQTYAEAIATGADKDLTKCSPGGRDTSKMLKKLNAELTISAKSNATSTVTTNSAATSPAAAPKEHQFSSAHFVSAGRLTGDCSAKDVRHVVLDLSTSGLKYEVGDSLGVMPRNCGDLVATTLDLLGLRGDEPVATPDGENRPIADALRSVYALGTPSDDLIELLAASATNSVDRESLTKLLADGVADGVQVPDLLATHPSARPTPAAFAAALVAIKPRLYSISSSLKAQPNQVHLTIGVVKYKNVHARQCKGVASTFLTERVDPGEQVNVFIHHSPGFRLPTDGTKPVIMIGPGTGIAPFRAFLYERHATKSTGKNWLFFGDQTRSSDFLYQSELESFVASGLVSRLDLAFSRDQAQKVYVQHRMLENAAELYQWLLDGGHIYVCGDAKRMAKDVNDALLEIIRSQGNLSETDANAYLRNLKESGRYARDVY